MMVDKTNSSHGIRYVGFVADLIQKLSEVVGFRYELYIAPDNKYGYRQNDGSWNGMVKELLDKVMMCPCPDIDTSFNVIHATFRKLYGHRSYLVHQFKTSVSHILKGLITEWFPVIFINRDGAIYGGGGA